MGIQTQLLIPVQPTLSLLPLSPHPALLNLFVFHSLGSNNHVLGKHTSRGPLITFKLSWKDEGKLASSRQTGEIMSSSPKSGSRSSSTHITWFLGTKSHVQSHRIWTLGVGRTVTGLTSLSGSRCSLKFQTQESEIHAIGIGCVFLPVDVCVHVYPCESLPKVTRRLTSTQLDRVVMNYPVSLGIFVE